MTFYLPNETIMISRRSGRWEAVQRIEHGLRRVPVVMACNQDSSDDVWRGETQFSALLAALYELFAPWNASIPSTL